jgi:hypothetical protein
MKKIYVLLNIILLLLAIILFYFIYNQNNFKKMEQECVMHGGEWMNFVGGFSGKEIKTCNLPMKDAGKWCNDSEQCESELCAVPGDIEEENLSLASSGTCYKWSMKKSGYYIEDGLIVRLEVDY